MREIKFRAWDDLKKQWLLGYELPSLGGFSIVGETMLMGEWSSVLTRMLHGEFGDRGEHLKVMQYTSLKDKNGKEIYEGDVVAVTVCPPDVPASCSISNNAEVFWSNGCFILRLDKTTIQNVEFSFTLDWNNEMEVIGNIYENPELLTI